MLESMTDASLRRRVQLLREAADIYPDHPKLESAIEQLNQLLGQIREEMDEATRLWSSGRIEQAIVCLQSIQRRAAGDTQLQRAEHRVRKYQQWLEQQLSRLERAIEEQAWGEALDVARQVVTIGAKRKDTDDDPATTPE
jgi:tetratricopeptide (TPR) repeat protein